MRRSEQILNTIDELSAATRKGELRRLLAHVGVGGVGGGYVGHKVDLTENNPDLKLSKGQRKLQSILKGAIGGGTLGVATGALHAAHFSDSQNKVKNKLFGEFHKARNAEEATEWAEREKRRADRAREWAERDRKSQQEYEEAKKKYDDTFDSFRKKYSGSGSGSGQQRRSYEDFAGSARSSYRSRQKSIPDIFKERTGGEIKTKADLKAWYRRKAKEHHPDRHMQAPELVRKEHEAKFKAAETLHSELQKHPDFDKFAALKLAVLKVEGLYADPEYQKVQRKYNDGNLEDKFQYHAYKRALDRATYNYHAKTHH